jgi:hypothetical protein
MSHREFCVRITLGSLSPSLPQRLVVILATFTVLSFVTFQRPCRTIAAEPSQDCQEHKNDVLNHERSVNACVMLRPNKFDPPMIFFPKLTRSKILTPSFSHTAIRCGSPTLPPPLPRLAHSGCPQSRATPPLTPRSRCWPMAPVLRQDKLTP